MAIPDRPMNFRPLDLTLDDYIWLGEWVGTDRKDADPATFKRLRAMLPECSDWTAEEVGRVKMRELTDVLSQMTTRGAMEEAIPPANGDGSLPGATA